MLLVVFPLELVVFVHVFGARPLAKLSLLCVAGVVHDQHHWRPRTPSSSIESAVEHLPLTRRRSLRRQV